ncbi:MAG: bifunctional riboflavin kinase/FAD synthetase [Proteobacteria bacterium]|nr:bifunctional riboflavin kinase/FAD synthetase [Pseudomonadota bacterium]
MTVQDHDPQQFILVRDAVADPGALRGTVIALGNFDGVHRGHRAVIGTAITRARALGAPAAVMTFEPHPRAYFKPDEPLFRLTDDANKLRLLAMTGLDGTVVMTFDADLAAMTATDFVRRVLVGALQVRGVVVGFNFHFGHNRAGTPEFLRAQGKAHGFSVDIVPAHVDNGQVVSSGPIRAALAEGDVSAAAALLGYPWFVTGDVVQGDRRGRDLGFPTANLRLDPACGLRHGIYAVRATVGGKRHDGVASFGRRPMFDTGAVLLEVFLFDFSADIYGQAIDVAFVAWIRPEMHFDTIEDLVRRMQEDTRIALAMLARAPAAVPPVEGQRDNRRDGH